MPGISNIENGMTMGEVRTILNQVIDKINTINSSPTDYNDLDNKPAIDGVELTSQSSMSDFEIEIEDTSIVESLEDLAETKAAEVSATITNRTIETALALKLDKAFENFTARQYEFSENTLVAIRHGNATYKATMKDLATYIAYMLQNNGCCCRCNCAPESSESASSANE